jgi:hypothetical protein
LAVAPDISWRIDEGREHRGEGSVFEILLPMTDGTSPLLPAGRAEHSEPATCEIYRRG